MDSVVKTLRGLLNSTKNGLLEKQLRRDFREMEGCDIPYKKYGYNTLLEFLRASNEFDLMTTNEGIHVRAKILQNSLHIVELVGTQNCVKKKKSKAMPFIPRFQSNFSTNNYSKPGMTASRKMSNMPPQRRQPFANGSNRNNTSSFRNENWNDDWNRPQQSATRTNSTGQYTNYAENSSLKFNIQTNQTKFDWNRPSQPQTAIQTNSVPVNNGIKIGSGINPVNTNYVRNENPLNKINSMINKEKFDRELYSNQPSQPIIKTGTLHWQNDSNKKQSQNVQPVTENPNQSHGVAMSVSNDEGRKTLDDKKWKHDLYETSQLTATKVSSNVMRRLTNNFADKLQKSAMLRNLDELSQRIGPQSTDTKVDPSNNIRKGLQKVSESVGVSSSWLTTDVKLAKKLNESSTENALDTVDDVPIKHLSKQVGHEVNVIEQTKKEKEDPKQRLEIYCKRKGYDPPEYSCSLSRFKKFTGSVNVEGVTYTTDPFDYASELGAENAAASNALANVKEFTISKDSSEQIARKIYDCIGNNGVFLKYVPNIFEQAYDQSLPEGWINIIQNRPEMFSVVQQLTNMSIVFKNLPVATIKPSTEICTDEIKGAEDRPDNDTNKNSCPDQNEAVELAPLKLPWDDSFWSVYITMASSTVDVWGHIMNCEDWENLNTALEQIESNLLKGIFPNRCQKIVDDGIYLAVHRTQTDENPNHYDFTVYRVRIQSIDHSMKKALCFYIDDGFEEWLEYDTLDTMDSKLYQIDNSLLKIPALAIPFSLFNLQDFAENAYAKEEVGKQLSDRSFVAKIRSTQTQFEAQLESVDLEARICVILYDTSTQEDILMNKKILEEICTNMTPPQFEQQKTNVVHVTHISDTGEIYCRLHGSKDMHTIKQIIHRLTDRINSHRVNPGDLNDKASSQQTLYLVFEKSSGRWYRAMILSPLMQRNEMAMCKFVDHGKIDYISYENIYNLERLSMALSKYPHQAITVRLNGLNQNDLSPKVISRLRKLMCDHEPIFFKILTRTGVPMVNAWRRIDGFLLKINDSIRMELDFEASSKMANSDDTFNSTEDEDDQIDLPMHPKPQLDETYDATVITALNPSYFYVRLDNFEPEFTKMISCLWKECINVDELLPKNNIKENHFYAGQLRDGYWHRVKVQCLLSDEVAVVYKWDFGDIENVSIDALRPLDQSFRKIPQTVLCARLHGLQPVKNSWNKDDCAHFQELTVGKKFKVNVKYIQNDTRCSEKYITELILISQKNENIAEQLVREVRAKYV